MEEELLHEEYQEKMDEIFKYIASKYIEKLSLSQAISGQETFITLTGAMWFIPNLRKAFAEAVEEKFGNGLELDDGSVLENE